MNSDDIGDEVVWLGKTLVRVVTPYVPWPRVWRTTSTSGPMLEIGTYWDGDPKKGTWFARARFPQLDVVTRFGKTHEEAMAEVRGKIVSLLNSLQHLEL